MIIEIEEVLSTYKCREAGLKALEKHKHLFPLKASAKLAGIVADLMGDGHLQGEPRLLIFYTSKDIKELQRFEEVFFSIFKVKGNIRKNTTNTYGTYNYSIACKPIGRILVLLGVPMGAKVLKQFSIPKWILNSKECFRIFVRRLFDCEGTVDIKYKFVEVKMYKCEILIKDGFDFFNDIKYYLEEYFNIKSTNVFTETKSISRKDGIKTKAIRLKIKNKKSVLKFYQEIGFENKKKKEKLKGCIF